MERFPDEITLLLGVLVAVFMALNWRLLVRLPRVRLLLTAYAFLVVAWVAAAVGTAGLDAGGATWVNAFKLVEHVCFLASSVVVAVWCRAALCAKGDARP